MLLPRGDKTRSFGFFQLFLFAFHHVDKLKLTRLLTAPLLPATYEFLEKPVVDFSQFFKRYLTSYMYIGFLKSTRTQAPCEDDLVKRSK